jgi:hypothetical protein
MNGIHARSHPARRHASAEARVATQFADSDRARCWAVVTAFAFFLAVMLVRIVG